MKNVLGNTLLRLAHKYCAEWLLRQRPEREKSHFEIPFKRFRNYENFKNVCILLFFYYLYFLCIAQWNIKKGLSRGLALTIRSMHSKGDCCVFKCMKNVCKIGDSEKWSDNERVRCVIGNFILKFCLKGNGKVDEISTHNRSSTHTWFNPGFASTSGKKCASSACMRKTLTNGRHLPHYINSKSCSLVRTICVSDYTFFLPSIFTPFW